MSEPQHAVIWDEPTEGIWRWSAGRKARFVQYGGRVKAVDLARSRGAVFALWGPSYGYPGSPGDAQREKLERCVREAAERAAAHPHG